MLKMTETEARQYVENEGLEWEDHPELVRECADCEQWVLVDDFCGTHDCCDACLDW